MFKPIAIRHLCASYALRTGRQLLALLALLFGLCPSSLLAAADERALIATPAPVAVRLSIVKTGSRKVPEAMMVSGGRWTHEMPTHFSAFLIQHGTQHMLFDTGLGRHISTQYRQDMPLWLRPFFRYEDPVNPARAQLDAAGIAPVQAIYLSHSHWDHASGLVDFPEATVWLPAPEMATVTSPQGGLGGAWPSQVASPAIRWRSFDFQPIPFEGFAGRHDVFGDGSVVMVPLYGHTPGSIGLFVRVSSGQRYFLVGDAVWSARALAHGSPKFWLARMLVDRHGEHTQQGIERIRAAMARDPQLRVLPAHDGSVQESLGYFPRWLD